MDIFLKKEIFKKKEFFLRGFVKIFLNMGFKKKILKKEYESLRKRTFSQKWKF